MLEGVNSFRFAVFEVSIDALWLSLAVWSSKEPLVAHQGASGV